MNAQRLSVSDLTPGTGAKARNVPTERVAGVRRILALGFVALAAAGAGSGAWAACYRLPNVGESVFTLDLGTVTISPDLPVGGIVTTKRFQRVTTPTINAHCDNGGTVHYDMTQGTPVSGLDKVYTTGVKGLGIRLKNYIGGTPTFAFPNVITYTGTTDLQIDPTSYYDVELIKTEAVTGSGPLNPGQIARSYADDGKSLTSVSIPANGVTIVSPSCAVDAGSRNIPVQFGAVARSRFTGVGTSAGSRAFNIQLNCSAGVAANNTIYLRMDATSDPSGQPGVLQIAQGANAAAGVGIQVLDGKNAPVKFGEDALVGPSKDGTYVVPYTASYYQTAPGVTVGAANSAATFSVLYK